MWTFGVYTTINPLSYFGNSPQRDCKTRCYPSTTLVPKTNGITGLTLHRFSLGVKCLNFENLLYPPVKLTWKWWTSSFFIGDSHSYLPKFGRHFQCHASLPEYKSLFDIFQRYYSFSTHDWGSIAAKSPLKHLDPLTILLHPVTFFSRTQ